MLEIDLAAIIPADWLTTMSEASLRETIIVAAEAARAKWIKLSMEKLRTSQQAYTAAISAVRVDGDVAWVSLDGLFPNMIERGFDPFDMRDTLLGPNVPVVDIGGGKGKHRSKDGGFYRAIPFRMMGGRATGRNAQRTTDVYASELGEARAKKLGRLAEKKMKTLAPTLSNPGQPTVWGERLRTSSPTGSATALSVMGHGHALASGPSAPGVEGNMWRLVKHGGAEHKSPLFEGAMRFEQHYEHATQSHYGTFRTISTNSKDGWIHPGYQPGAHLADEAHEHAMRVLSDMFKKG